MHSDRHTQTFVVEPHDCINLLDPTLPDLLGTYILVKWMEITAATQLGHLIDSNRISVGARVDIEHTGMAKLGDTIRITSRLIAHDDKNAAFAIKAHLGDKQIATADHRRTILPKKLLGRMMR
jgi:predicted thioesterase